jgi:phytoene dehydrogenase-like protein
MFISVSNKNDQSAPDGYRSVMISTHCKVEDWFNINSYDNYKEKKKEISQILLNNARKIYPNLGKSAENDYLNSKNLKSNGIIHNDVKLVFEVATPRTFYGYTKREFGSVGGYCLDMENSNFFAIPQNILSKENIWIVGDTTWPGLGIYFILN